MNSLNFFSVKLNRTIIYKRIIASIVSCLFFTTLSLASNATLSTLPQTGISFTENKGQVIDTEGKLHPDILFTGHGPGMALFIRNTGISYVFHQSNENKQHEHQQKHLEEQNHFTHRVDAEFIGCNQKNLVEKKDQEQGHKNFYYPHCKDGITNVKSYGTIVQKNLYNNIDVIYKGAGVEGIKYDLVVRPGGNPKDIKTEYKGADSLQITKEGSLQIITSLGELSEWIPRVYQNSNGKIVDVKARYVLTGNVVSLQLNSYNLQLPLIIDPWVTYFGGSKSDEGITICTDINNNIVFTGFTQSQNFPTLGALQSSLNGSMDTYINKINEAGSIQWSTYYGGSLEEYGSGVCADNYGDIYVCGFTRSIDFPTGAVGGQTSFLSNYPGQRSAFLLKLNSAGIQLWSTYYGDATGITRASSVATDQNNEVILCGQTTALSNIATVGSLQSTKSSGSIEDAFVAKFSSTGNRIWATYYGGSNKEISGDISCDSNNNIYFSGVTRSPNLVTFQAHQASFGGGQEDAFLVKLNSTGALLWSTYYGGNGREDKTDIYDGHGLAPVLLIDLNGDLYLGGITGSASNIATSGAFQTTLGPSMDGFLAKFNSNGTRLWATYIGGNIGGGIDDPGFDYITGIAVDKDNNVLVGGDTYCTNFPVTSCSYQTSLLGNEDQFLAAFNPNGKLICAGYIGQKGKGDNETYDGGGFGGCIAASDKFIYLIATTICNYNYPITTNACQGGTDAVVAQLCPLSCGLPHIVADLDSEQMVACHANDSVNFLLNNNSCDTIGSTFFWSFEGGSPSTSTDQNPANIIYNTEGIYDVTVTIKTPCKDSTIIKADYVEVGQNFPVASFTATPQPTSLNSPIISFINQSTGSVQWEWNFGDVAGASSDQQNPYFTYSDSGNYIVRLVAINQYGCTDTIEHFIRIEDALSFYAPNTFTPNGDNINDVFSPKYEGIINGDYLFTIYDRWGQLIFSTKDPGKGWNGKANGGAKLAQIDTYVWKVQLKDKIGDKHEYLGHVNLIR